MDGSTNTMPVDVPPSPSTHHIPPIRVMDCMHGQIFGLGHLRVDMDADRPSAASVHIVKHSKTAIPLAGYRQVTGVNSNDNSLLQSKPGVKVVISLCHPELLFL